MARPRKGEEKDRPKHIGFRAATWVHDGVLQLAEQREQPYSEVAHDLMESALRRLGIKPSQEEEAATARRSRKA
jgi:hypothetical protein